VTRFQVFNGRNPDFIVAIKNQFKDKPKLQGNKFRVKPMKDSNEIPDYIFS